MSFFNRLTILNFANACFSYWVAQKTENDFLAFPASIAFSCCSFLINLTLKSNDRGTYQLFEIAGKQVIPASIGFLLSLALSWKVQKAVAASVMVAGLALGKMRINLTSRQEARTDYYQENGLHPASLSA